MAAHRYIVLSFFTFLAGCISLSRQEKTQHLLSTPSLEKSTQSSLETGFLTEGHWPQERWWEIFESPTLSSWIDIALAKNPSLLATQSRVSLAKEQAAMVQSKLLPSLFFHATDSISHLSEHSILHMLNPALPLNVYDVTFSFSFQYEFDFWRKNKNLFLAAVGEMKTKEAEFQQAEVILSTSLAAAYFSLSINLKKQTLYESLYQIHKQQLLLQKQLQLGALSSKFPILQEDAFLQKAEQELAGIQDELISQRHQINTLMGRGPDEEIDLQKIHCHTLPSFSLPSNLSLDLVSHRPDLIALLWRVESLAHEIGAARADFFPNINLAALVGLDSISLGSLFHTSSQTGSLTPALHLPIFTAGAIRANVQAKWASFHEAVFQYNQHILQSAQEIATLLSHMNTIYLQKDLQQHIVDDATQRLCLTRLRKEGGLDSTFSLWDFEEQLIRKKLQDLDLLYEKYLLFVKLIQALGGGYQV
jgi:NodT family efflux transporter outer membrane factor (OMF) lipoprotein